MKTGRSNSGDRRKAPAKDGNAAGENWEQQADYPVPLEEGKEAKAGAETDEPSGREAQIRLKAYYRAQRRGFDGGNEMDDWLAAEREVDGERGDRR